MKNLRDYILEGVMDIDTNIDSAAPVTKEVLDAIDWKSFNGNQPSYWPYQTLYAIESEGNKYKNAADLNANFRCMLNPEYTDGIRSDMYKCITKGYDVRPSVKLTKGDLKQLGTYLWWTHYTKGNLEVFLPYLKNKKFNEFQLNMIAQSIGLGVDVKKIANPKLKPDQIRSLAYCLRDGADITKFNDPEFDEGQMRVLGDAQLRLKKDQFEVLLNPEITKRQIMELTDASEHGFDISTVDWVQYDEEQVICIVKNILDGKDVTKILDPDMPAKNMRRKRLPKK